MVFVAIAIVNTQMVESVNVGMMNNYNQNGYFRLVSLGEERIQLAVDGLEDPNSTVVFCEWGSGEDASGVVHTDNEMLVVPTLAIHITTLLMQDIIAKMCKPLLFHD